MDEVPPELMRRLEAYDWPGNVRELQNVVERAVLVSSDGVLRLAEPLAETATNNVAPPPRTRGATRPPRPTLEEVERDYISEVLGDCGGRIAGAGGAAEVVGLHPNTLRSRMKKLGIPVGRASRKA